MSNSSHILQEKSSINLEIQRYMKILDDPSSEISAMEAALEGLTQRGAFKYISEIVEDTWKPIIIREKALDALTRIPKGNEDILLSIVNDRYALQKFRKMALEGLIKAESHNHLLTVINGIDTPEWARKQAGNALHSNKSK